MIFNYKYYVYVGKPIIATSVGGIPEAIINENNGVLINPDLDLFAKNKSNRPTYALWIGYFC